MAGPSSTPHERVAATRSWDGPALAALGVVLVVYLCHAGHFWAYTNDDAYITLRYSRFLAMGRGPYFNPGEHVEGYTNPSLMLLMAAFIRVAGPAAAPFAAKLLGVFCGAGAVALAFALTGSLLGRIETLRTTASWWGLVTAGLVAVNPSFALNGTSGLETMLFAVGLALAVHLATNEDREQRWKGSGLAFAATALTRPEGLVLCAACWLPLAVAALGDCARNHDRRRLHTLILNGAIVAFACAAHVAARHHFYDGEWLPNTYYAKEGGFWGVPPLTYIREGLPPALFGFAGLATAAAGYACTRHLWRAALPLALTALCGGLLPLATGTDWMPGSRLLMPYLPLAAASVVTGWALLCARLPAPRRALGVAIAAATVPILWAAQAPLRERLYTFAVTRARGYETGHIALANWLRDEAARPGDTVAMMDIGIVGYTCIDQAILDLTGLTDRFIAKSPGSFVNKQYDPGYVLDRQPRFVVLTITAPNRPSEPVSPESTGTFWTHIEARIYRDVRFQRDYIDHHAAVAEGPDWLRNAARGLGAVRVFEHAYPGRHYLLAVFRHRDTPDVPTGT